ncbi:MAG: Na/Pi symporter, partial [Clostridia bacterium]
SSAATGVLLAFASANIMTFDTAMFMILGTNIGTCVTAIISSVGTSVNARRTATIHLLFNVLGTLIVLLPMLLWKMEIANFFMNISGSTQRAIANFHTIFNIVNTIILFPFINQLVSLSKFIIKDKKVTETRAPKRLYYLDERLLHTPSIAVAQTLSEVKNMGDIANYNLHAALNMLMTGNSEKMPVMEHNEEILNYLNIEVTNYLVKFSGLEMTKKDETRIASLFHVIADVERIGDHAENIWKYAQKMEKSEILFSADAIAEIKAVDDTLSSMYVDTMNAFLTSNREILAKIEQEESSVDEAKRMMEKMHIERLNQGACTAEAGAIYLSLSSQLERVADHLTNIAYSFLPYKDKLTLGDIKKN